MTTPPVSIVIRCYNEEEHIERLLTGIYEQTLQDPEVILVDSGSTDRTLTLAAKYPVLVEEISPSEFSFGSSLNIGCQVASGDFLIFASAHVYPVYNDWLEQLLAPFADPKVALVYGKQRGNQTTKYSEHQILAKWFPNDSNFSQNHPFCNNANVAIRRKIWDRIPYDETLTGLEDIDWAKRVLKLAHKIAYAAEAEVIHAHDETPGSILNRYRREAIAMKRIFPQEGFSLWDFARLFIANSLHDLYHAWHDDIFWKVFGQIFVFRMMQFWGTYLGYAQRGPINNQLRQTFYYPNGFSREFSKENQSQAKKRIEYASDQSDGQINPSH
jgi:glycosyltransferase involved in cell wall biosynthesis